MTRPARLRALALLLLACAACAPGRAPAGRAPLPGAREAHAPAVVAALAARERAQHGLRLAMTLTAEGSGIGSLVGAPAYLALPAPGTLRLQVLSPFGVTTADLRVRGDAYRLALPLRGETRRGRIEPALLARDGALLERMIVALALLFRPLATAGACVGDGDGARCALPGGLTRRVVVDAAHRPVRDELLGHDDTLLITATYDAWDGRGPTALPARITLRDEQSAATLRIALRRARRTGA